MPFYSKTELIDQLNQMKIIPNKKKGQCYLIDRNIVNIILDSAKLNGDNDEILEIGPGLGTLTDGLLLNSKKLYLIEYDQRLAFNLYNFYSKSYPTILIGPDQHTHSVENNKDSKIIIYNEDALNIEFPPINKIISNIPYQISGPLLLKILNTWNYHRVILMVQQEFADHCLSIPNSHTYSRISAALQLFLDINILHKVSKTCFYPEPQVESVILDIKEKSTLNRNSIEWKYHKQYLEFLHGVFPYKNKTLRKALSFYFKLDLNAKKIFKYLDNIIHDPIFDGKRIRNMTPSELFSIMYYSLTSEKY